VDLIEVDRLHAQPIEAVRKLLFEGLPREPAGVRIFVVDPIEPFVATTWASRSYSARAFPRTRSLSPFEYMLAVSKKLIPRSIARSTSSRPYASPLTHSRQSGSPKLIQPRQIFETSMPVDPSVAYSMTVSLADR
jgi:hypothetical protein